MSNKQTIIDNNSRIEAITNRLNNSTLADVRDTTTTANDVLSGKEFYGSNGQKVSGTIETFTPTEVTENTTLQTAGKYVNGNIVVNVAGSGSGEDMLQARVDSTNSCNALFAYYEGENVDFATNLDTSRATTTQRMFYDCQKLKYIPQFDIGNVTNMLFMFSGCRLLEEIPLLNTSKVTSFRQVFYTCEALKSIPQFDTGSVTDMQQAFYMCRTLTTIPLLNTSKVTTMQEMFANCSALTTISQLDTSSCTNMRSMFKTCPALTSIPFLDTSKVTTMEEMFNGCSKLTTIPQLNMSSVTRVNNMFGSCSSLTSVPELDTKRVTQFPGMFSGCTNLQTVSFIDMRNNNSSTTYMFKGCKNLTNLTLKNIKIALQIGSGSGTGSSDYGHLLTLDSLINTIKELWDYSSGSTTYKLTIGTANLEKIANTYVKLVDVTDEMIAQDDLIASKKPCVVCESTDEGAMTITEYALLKKWSLA